MASPNSENDLPYGFAKRHGLLLSGDTLLLTDPPNPTALAEVRRRLNQPIKYQVISKVEFERRLSASHDNLTDGAAEAIDALGADLSLDDISQALSEPEDLLESQDDAPIIRLINALLTQAVKLNASDVHLDPFEKRLLVRMRVDGVLRDVMEPPLSVGPLLISRIKIMGHLNIAEKRLPQDGRISLKLGNRAVDVRVSTLPSGSSERVVMRLLDKQAGRLDLAHLGMGNHTLEGFESLIKQPNGIILVTGPTGSGKTTTLYAALAKINDGSRNILTVEDPIEYFIDGIGQTQVNTKAEMSFARSLRAMLRQDPDVVMVGEIRDEETARIAIQASLTGHLVFSTLHTNTAAGAVTRLRDIGIEPFLLSSSLIGVLAQRLVRSLCPECKEAYQPDVAQWEMLGIEPDGSTRLYRATGCSACGHSGYSGRTGLYELFLINHELRTMIHDGASEHDMSTVAAQRHPTIRKIALDKLLTGDTSLEEVMRISRDI